MSYKTIDGEETLRKLNKNLYKLKNSFISDYNQDVENVINRLFCAPNVNLIILKSELCKVEKIRLELINMHIPISEATMYTSELEKKGYCIVGVFSLFISLGAT